MSTALARNPGIATKWTIVNGAMRGAVRLVHSSQFTIGRSTENEIVLVNDPKVSRRHAEILCTPQGVEIISLNDKNPVRIQGESISRGWVSDNDIVEFGDTHIQFNMTGATSPDHIQLAPRMHQSAPKKSANKKWLVYGVVGLVVLWILLPSGRKQEGLSLRTQQQIQADIDAATKLRETTESQLQKRDDMSITSRQAQEHYVRGARDFRRGQYERSITSFEACLALNPNHVLCNRYSRLAQRKFNELIQYDMVLGRKYRDQNQFKACRAAFRNAMLMVKDTNSPVYQEAKLNYEACNNLVEGRY